MYSTRIKTIVKIVVESRDKWEEPNEKDLTENLEESVKRGPGWPKIVSNN